MCEARKKPTADSENSKVCLFFLMKSGAHVSTVNVWLLYDEPTRSTLCSAWRQYTYKYNKTNGFSVQTKLTGHWKQVRQDGTRVRKTVQAPKETTTMKAVGGLKTAMLFRNVCTVAKKGQPLKDYEWQCEYVVFPVPVL